MKKRAIEFDKMLDVYFDSIGMQEDRREEYKRCTSEDTFKSFSSKLNQILAKQPVIKALVMKCRLNDKRKFKFDLWIKEYRNKKLRIILGLDYNPDLYRDYFLHPFLFSAEERVELSFQHCGRCEHLEIGLDEDGHEWMMGDHTYIEELCEILGVKMDISKEMKIPIVEYRRLIVDEIARSPGIMLFCLLFGKMLKKTIEKVFALKPDEIQRIANTVIGLSEKEYSEELSNCMFFCDVIKWIKNENSCKKDKGETTGNYGLCDQEIIDVEVARNFWYIFLLSQSKLELMRKWNEEEKKSTVFSEELLRRKDSLKEAYECARNRKANKSGEFATKMNYLQHVLEGMDEINMESFMKYPICWLLGDRYKTEEATTIDFPRNIYYRHMVGKKAEENDRTRNDHHAYNINFLRKKLVDKFDDDAWLCDMVIMLQPMSIKEQVTFIHAILGKESASEFYEVYIWIQQITTYLLLIYDEESFISRYNYFCEMLLEIVVALQELRRESISNKNP